jgi:hypothetical protein
MMINLVKRGSVLNELYSRALTPHIHQIQLEHNNKQKMIDAPEPFDVLLGRKKAIQKRPGNKLIRHLIDQNCHSRYDQAPRRVKRAIANEIVLQGIKSKIGKLFQDDSFGIAEAPTSKGVE